MFHIQLENTPWMVKIMLLNERKPDWLKIKHIANRNINDVDEIVKEFGLNTVCDEAMCPNRTECFSKRTATFMILGSRCTRNCTFCNVRKKGPDAVDKKEPEKVAAAVHKLRLVYVVITSVTRDDLPDGGASHFAKCINEIRKLDSEIKVEVLIPDFKGNTDALRTVVNAGPFVLNHNIETVKRLYPMVRPEADYLRSLELIKKVKEMDSKMHTKSGIMLGLGEEKKEIIDTLKDLVGSGCEFLTIGQYLAPSKEHHKVIRYVHPDEFKEYWKTAIDLGFKHVASAPFVRSSYHAFEAISF